MNKTEKKSLLARPAFQTILASIFCVLIGLVIGFIVLLIINYRGAWGAITAILKNFLFFKRADVAMEYFGSTLVKFSPLLMCTLSILFAYKVGLFNIGCSGQYAVGAGLALYCGLGLHLPWIVCILAAMVGGAVMGAIVGILKAYRNVNEVIAGIMLNWISLYAVNMLLTNVKETSTTLTQNLATNAPAAMIPSLGLNHLFSDNPYVTIALPLSIIIAILVWFVMDKTKLGFELKATGLNKSAAKYAGMKENRNIILTMVIAGCLAALGAAFFFLSGIEQWDCSQTTVPAMGFNGIAAAFLGGLNPIGSIFSAYFIQHITSGGAYVDKMIYASQTADLITSIIIYFCGFVLFFKQVMSRNVARRAEKKLHKGGAKS